MKPAALFFILSIVTPVVGSTGTTVAELRIATPTTAVLTALRGRPANQDELKWEMKR